MTADLRLPESSFLYPAYTAAAGCAEFLLGSRSRIGGSPRRDGGDALAASAIPSERFQASDRIAPGSLWIHAASLGEINAAYPLIQEIQQSGAGTPILLTTSTVRGLERAQALREDLGISTAACPFDSRRCVNAFLDAARPRALVLVEKEFWPALLRESALHGVPVALASGVVRDAYLRPERRTLYRWMLRHLARAGVQTEAYAANLRALTGSGGPEIAVTGNLKFDSAPEPILKEEADKMRADLGLDAHRPILIFGSTRLGEEKIAARCLRHLLPAHPDLRLVVVPRDFDKRDTSTYLGPFQDCPGGAVLLSKTPGDSFRTREARVLVVDRIGLLNHLYALADIAVIGGSLLPGIHGHNPIEPAAQGTPVVFGPHMRNWTAEAALLQESGAAVGLPSHEALEGILDALLSDRTRRSEMGAAGLRVVRSNQGRAAATLEFLAPLFDRPH